MRYAFFADWPGHALPLAFLSFFTHAIAIIGRIAVKLATVYYESAAERHLPHCEPHCHLMTDIETMSLP